MKILVLNSGSSSIKFKLYDFPSRELLLAGSIERIGEADSSLRLKGRNLELDERVALADHRRALESLEEIFKKSSLLDSFEELGAVGHRVVHGGEDFEESVLIDEEVMGAIKRNVSLAPLHNPANIEGIEVIGSLSPSTPQVAVFDTAFHQTIPPEAYIYALEIELYEKYGIRRYGFHGSSHSFVCKRASEMAGMDSASFDTITLHLGNGASVCAIKGGKSIETSMGFTPLEGLVMGSRSGDIDPAIIFHLYRELGMSLQEIERLLNRRSGLKGLCGESDMREIELAAASGNERALAAIDIFVHRIIKYIGAYFVLLGGADAIVFTGGIGENSSYIRARVCERLEALGVRFDSELNERGRGDFLFSTKDSALRLYTVHTDEESVIAEDTYRIVSLAESMNPTP